MNDYFPQDNGIGVRIGNGVKQVLQIIANRFIADNPPIPVKYYLRSSRNFHISEDYMDEIALHKKNAGACSRAVCVCMGKAFCTSGRTV
ncbi:MAG: hypothetical protein ACLVGL_06465 [Waltera sp.]